MRFLSFAGVAAGLAVIAAILAACVVVEEGPGYRPPPRPEEPRFCTREYDPVCGERRGDRQTFGNSCMARAEGYNVVYRGECRRERPPQACTQEYRPVCAERGRDQRTFSNECVARGSGYSVIREGECRSGGGIRPPGAPGSSEGGFTNRPPQVCTREYAPVCGRLGSSMRTFGNACEAEAARYSIVRRGAC